MLDDNQAGFLQLKSKIYSLVAIPRHGAAISLHKDTVKFLESTCPEILASLPGYVAAPKLKKSQERFARMFDQMPRHTHGKSLQSIFDHKVFQEFTFLRLAM
jgi:hypothetical protein